MSSEPLVLRISDIRRSDACTVDGKTASLAEMIGRLKNAGTWLPAGSATTAETNWGHCQGNATYLAKIHHALKASTTRADATATGL